MGVAARRQREKRVRKEQIMSAAKRLFSSKGFNGTTMEDIAAEVELSTSALYLYFKNKEELYASLSLQILLKLLESFESISTGQNQDPIKQFMTLKDKLFAIYEYDPEILINVFHFQTSELLKNMSPDTVVIIKDIARRALNAIASIYQEGVRQGVFIERKPIAVADFVWSTFAGLVIWEEAKLALGSRNNYMRQTLDLAFEFIIHGMLKPKT